MNNIDVLDALLNINNERLSVLAQEKIFSNILDFASIDNKSLVHCNKLNRFCIEILPKIHLNVKYFILEPISMERILLAANYPNLTKLKIFNFKQEISLYYFTNNSSVRYIFQQQITDLILVSNQRYSKKTSQNYTKNIYAHILNFFKNLKHLNIVETFIPSCPSREYSIPIYCFPSYPGLSLCNLPPTAFSSSTLTHLCININTFDDCLYLLDGRCKQLTTFIIRVYSIKGSSTIVHNMEDLPNLKCFSLKYYFELDQYDNTVLPLLRRMSNLEQLTLYLRIINRNTFIDDNHLQNEILVYMPQLHSFTFYICTYSNTVGLFHHVPDNNIPLTFTNIKQQRVAKIVNYIEENEMVYSIFSLPFTFDHLEDIGNIFPNIVFKNVTYLCVNDIVPFNHDFFIRIARAFPFLKSFRIQNFESQSVYNHNIYSSDNNQSDLIAEFPYLTSLAVRFGDIDYIEQFLNETKTYVPCLTELSVGYSGLEYITKNFTREETRRNCAKIKRLTIIIPLVHSKDFYLYFPSLQM